MRRALVAHRASRVESCHGRSPRAHASPAWARLRIRPCALTSSSTSSSRERSTHLQRPVAACRQRLLEHPVDAEVDARRQRPGISIDAELDRAPRPRAPRPARRSGRRRAVARAMRAARRGAGGRRGSAACRRGRRGRAVLDRRHRRVGARSRSPSSSSSAASRLDHHRADVRGDQRVSSRAIRVRSSATARRTRLARSASIRSALRASSASSSRRRAQPAVRAPTRARHDQTGDRAGGSWTLVATSTTIPHSEHRREPEQRAGPWALLGDRVGHERLDITGAT